MARSTSQKMLAAAAGAIALMLLAVGRHPITRGFKASVVFGALVNLFLH